MAWIFLNFSLLTLGRGREQKVEKGRNRLRGDFGLKRRKRMLKLCLLPTIVWLRTVSYIRFFDNLYGKSRDSA